MVRTIVMLLVMGTTTVASAQVVFEPPPQIVTYHDYYYEAAMARLAVLSRPRVRVFIGAEQPAAVAGGAYYGRGYGYGPTAVFPVPSGIDPLTGESLYFRMSDLLPPLPPAPEMRNVMDIDNSPARRPTGAGAGQISIQPWRGWDAARARGR